MYLRLLQQQRNVSQLVSEKCSYMYTYSYVSEPSVSCTCPYPHPVTLFEGYFIVFFILPQNRYQIQSDYGVFSQDFLRKARQRFLETKQSTSHMSSYQGYRCGGLHRWYSSVLIQAIIPIDQVQLRSTGTVQSTYLIL